MESINDYSQSPAISSMAGGDWLFLRDQPHFKAMFMAFRRFSMISVIVMDVMSVMA